MPYFRRKPTETIVDSARPRLPIPGLPSRGPAAGAGEKLSALTGAGEDVVAARSASADYSGLKPPLDAQGFSLGPAPVISAAGPVAPGGMAQTAISLVNEDEQPARIAFFCTSLIGDDGANIALDRVSFEPRELMLSAGMTGDVIVRVMVPSHTRCGVYAGLIRASEMDHVNAVLVVRVETP